jgi:hypothetical protein
MWYPMYRRECVEFPASIVEPAPAEALPEAEARDGTLIDDAVAKRMGGRA